MFREQGASMWPYGQGGLSQQQAQRTEQIQRCIDNVLRACAANPSAFIEKLYITLDNTRKHFSGKAENASVSSSLINSVWSYLDATQTNNLTAALNKLLPYFNQEDPKYLDAEMALGIVLELLEMSRSKNWRAAVVYTTPLGYKVTTTEASLNNQIMTQILAGIFDCEGLSQWLELNGAELTARFGENLRLEAEHVDRCTPEID